MVLNPVIFKVTVMDSLIHPPSAGHNYRHTHGIKKQTRFKNLNISPASFVLALPSLLSPSP